MKKYRQLLQKKRVMYGAGVLLAIIIAIFLVRGFIRSTVLPAAASLVYENRIQTTINGVRSGLGEYYIHDVLGWEIEWSYDADCDLNYASGISAQIGCSSSYSVSTPAVTDEYITKTDKTYAKLHKKLVSEGWHTYASNSTPKELNKLLTTTVPEQYGGYGGYIRYVKDFRDIRCYIIFSYFNDFGHVTSCSKKIDFRYP